jgi:hypothetical protein
VDREIELHAGETSRVEVALERQVDLRRRGWFAGDSHVHMNHGEKTIAVDFDQMAFAARAEDLQYLSVGHAWSLDDPSPERLEAELARRSRPDCVLNWNLEAPKNYFKGDAGQCLGHCSKRASTSASFRPPQAALWIGVTRSRNVGNPESAKGWLHFRVERTRVEVAHRPLCGKFKERGFLRRI